MKFQSGGAPIHEQVRDHLIDQIQDGTLAAGSVLPPERRLAEQFGVSRHTVRQALSALDGFGLVSIKHGSGITVTDSASDAAIERVSQAVIAREGSIERLVEVRRALEPYMARLTALRRTEEDLAMLEPLVAYDRPRDTGVAGGQSNSFHREIARAAHNPVFEVVMRTLISGPNRAEAILATAPEHRDEWESQHRDIFNAIAAGDGDAAETLMASHLDAVFAVARSHHECDS